jgi:predicted ABC-type exoprotein transport system permease subunit
MLFMLDVENDYHSSSNSKCDSYPIMNDSNVINAENTTSITILCILKLYISLQVWNTWGSISNSANYAFDWTDNTIFLLSNWGPITYVVSTFFFSWLADVKGEDRADRWDKSLN